jgi:hypothetical protein
MTDKQILIISAPDDTKPDWPVPPAYEPLYTQHDLEKRAVYLANPPGQWMFIGTVQEIVATYELALAVERRQVWQLSGLLEASK